LQHREAVRKGDYSNEVFVLATYLTTNTFHLIPTVDYVLISTVGTCCN